LLQLKDPPPEKLLAKGPPPALLEADIAESSAGLPSDVLYMLKSVRVFGHFETPLFVELCKHMETRTIPAGAAILPNGMIDESIYVVQSGKLSVFLQENNGSEHCLKDIRTGESIHSLLSILEVLTGQSAHVGVSARAMETTTVLRLPANAFKFLFSKYPDSLVRFVQIILLRLQRVTFLTLHKYFGLSKELIKPESCCLQKAAAVADLVTSGFPARPPSLFTLQAETEHEDSSDTEPERDIDQNIEPVPSSSSQPVPIRDSHRSVSVPIHIDRLKNVSQEGQQLIEGDSKMGSHPDLFVASSSSDFELAYEKAGLRRKEKSPVTAGTTVVAEKFKLGSFSDSSEDGKNVFERPEDDTEQTPLPQEEPDPAFGEAMHRLAKAIQLPESDEQVLVRLCSLSHLPEKSVLVKEGSHDSSLLFVLSGCLEVVQKASDETENFMYAVGPDELAGELAVVTGEPSFFTIRVLKQASLLIISKANFYCLLRVHPHAVLSVAYGLIQRTSDFIRQIDYALDWMQLQAGKALYRQGENAINCNIVLSGRLRSVVALENGEKEIMAEYGRGDTVGLVEVLTHAERATTVHAVRDTELAQIPDGLLNTIKRKHPQVVTHLIHILGNKMLFTYQRGSRISCKFCVCCVCVWLSGWLLVKIWYMVDSVNSSFPRIFIP
jgi:lysophospholipid hydrolase